MQKVYEGYLYSDWVMKGSPHDHNVLMLMSKPVDKWWTHIDELVADLVGELSKFDDGRKVKVTVEWE